MRSIHAPARPPPSPAARGSRGSSRCCPWGSTRSTPPATSPPRTQRSGWVWSAGSCPRRASPTPSWYSPRCSGTDRRGSSLSAPGPRKGRLGRWPSRSASRQLSTSCPGSRWTNWPGCTAPCTSCWSRAGPRTRGWSSSAASSSRARRRVPSSPATGPGPSPRSPRTRPCSCQKARPRALLPASGICSEIPIALPLSGRRAAPQQRGLLVGRRRPAGRSVPPRRLRRATPSTAPGAGARTPPGVRRGVRARGPASRRKPPLRGPGPPARLRVDPGRGPGDRHSHPPRRPLSRPPYRNASSA